ncbi:hypothetical protein OQA88_10999 [Cercophora sp. LCS_1]
MAENTQHLLRQILEAPYPKFTNKTTFLPMLLTAIGRSADEDNFEKLTSAYQACMDEPAIRELGVLPLAELVEQMKQLLPPDFGSVCCSGNALSDSILFLARYGVSAFATFSVGADDGSPDVVVASVSPPRQVGLPYKEHYSNSTLLKKYQEVVIEVLSQLTPEQENVLALVVDLEQKIAAALPTQEELQDITESYNPMSLRDASELTPSIGMPNVLSGLSPNYKVERLIVQSPIYMRKLEGILGGTSNAVLRSYLIWKVTQAFYPYIDSPIIKPYAAFVRQLDGYPPDSSTDRWRICTDHVDKGLGWMLDRFFVERAFPEAAKDFGGQVVFDIKNQLIAKLERSIWMDAETAGKAREKVRNISPHIGYPTQSPDITNPDALKSFYKTLSVRSTTHFQNALSIARFAVKDKWSTMGKPVDHGRWPTSVTIVDASYHPAGNSIMIPAGIMQFPIWSVDVPDYVTYGAFGFVIGHEVSHSLDATGRRYDENGRYGADWWTNKTAEAFMERAECFVGQYSNFTVPGPGGRSLHVNGRLTLDDNIADAGGVSMSFQAWRARRAADGPGSDASTRLPGLQDFTESQLFFLSYANWWCSKQRPETAVARLYTDPHAPEWARILGTMANSRDFLDSFKCENRAPTCELW